MKYCVRTVLSILCFILTTISVSAQQAPSFSLPVVNNVTPNGIVSCHVSVANFSAILAIQYVVKWNPAVVEFVSVDTYNLSALNSDDFGTAQVDSGILRMAWTSADVEGGDTAVDGTKIFRIRFRAIGPINSGTSLTFSEIVPETTFEVVQAGPNNALYDYDETECPLANGFIAIGYTTDTEEIFSNPFDANISPNPFSEKAVLNFELPESSDIQILITDALGRIVSDQRLKNQPAGKHGIEIGSTWTREKGWYQLRLQVGNENVVLPFLVQ